MIIYDDVPIADLVKKIFRETYGVEEDKLYHNAELRERIRNAVSKLRNSYDKPLCDTDYGDDEIRKAYMITYYPYYIIPACYVVENFVAPHISPRKIIQADFFASGPCPELLGTALALNRTKRCICLNVQTYDSEPAWFPYQQITFRHAKRLLKIIPPAVLLAHASERIETDIFFLQNFLSHLPCQFADNFLLEFSAVVTRTKSKTFFVFIDLNYGSVEKIFGKLFNENFLTENNLRKIAAHIPNDGEPLIIRHGDTTKSLRKNIFVGDDGLKQKKNTKFYFVVLQKI